MNDPEYEPPQPIPSPRIEWVIAAMFGLGIALAAVGVVAFVESQRFDPAPPREAGEKEWATPNERPAKSPASASAVPAGPGSAAVSASVDAVEEPMIEIEVSASASASAR